MYGLTDDVLTLPQNLVHIDDYAFNPTPENYLGEGAFGYVYKGYCTHDVDHKVAIKSIWSEKLKKTELELLAKVRSEYLVKLMSISSRGEITYVIMELCDGDLAGYLTKWTKLDKQNVTLLADNLARGYNVLQAYKIVHRDIKPQNILIKYKRKIGFGDKSPSSVEVKEIAVAKLSDFGTSHLLTTQDNDELCNVAGTLFYMAPEVGANLVATNGYDHSADMWSIGCVLYEAISGNTPFDESSLCRLFLHVACKNYHSLVIKSPSNDHENFDYVTNSLLRIDPKLRMTPHQFYDRAIGDMCKSSRKANVRHRFSVVQNEAHSKSFTYFNTNNNNDNNMDENCKNTSAANYCSKPANNSFTNKNRWAKTRAVSENRSMNRYSS